jgi:hypothetical protein
MRTKVVAALAASFIAASLAGCVGILGDFTPGDAGVGEDATANDGGAEEAETSPSGRDASDAAPTTNPEAGDSASSMDGGHDADAAEAGCPAGDIECSGSCVAANDPSHCGACATSCSGGTPLCSADASGAFGCVSGCGGTQTNCGGSCSDTTSDPNHCGSCTTMCTPPANATATCGGAPATCGYTCNAEYHQCGSACVDDSQVATCGSSCTACTAPANASATCTLQGAAYACGIGCDAGYHDCNGTCVSDSDVNTCGTMCSACPAPANGTATCALTSGQYACGATCGSGYHECNGSCSSDTSTATCGTSCTACTVPTNAEATCAGSPLACGATCLPGYATCSSGCTDLTSDPDNCGTCGHSCQGASCSNSACWPIVVGPSPDPVEWLALDGTNVYWTASNFVSGTTNRIDVYSCPLSGCTTATSVFTTQGSYSGIGNIKVGASTWANDLFFPYDSSTSSTYSVPKGGGGVTPLVSGLASGPATIAYDTVNEWVYTPEGGTIVRTKPDGTQSTVAVTGTLSVFYVYLDSTNIYWADNSGETMSRAPLGSTNASPTQFMAGGVI